MTHLIFVTSLRSSCPCNENSAEGKLDKWTEFAVGFILRGNSWLALDIRNPFACQSNSNVGFSHIYLFIYDVMPHDNIAH